MPVVRDIGPKLRNNEDVCIRDDGGFHAGSVRAKRNPRKTPIFYRGTKTDFDNVERLINELGYRGRADFFADVVGMTAIIAKAANELGYADRDALVRRALEALGFLEKRWPMPDWARFEDPSGIQHATRLDKPAP